MEKIKIIDNFLNVDDLNECLNIVNNKKWYYGHSSGYDEKFNNTFFAIYNLEYFFTQYIKSKLENVFSKNLY